MEKNNNQKQEEFVEQSALDEQEVANTADQEMQDSADASEASIEEKLVAELESAKDRYVRLYAEFDNYKRRTAKERVELMQSASKDVIGNLLTVLDDFDRAIKMMETATDVSAVKEGVELINQKFKNILTQQGLKEMSVMGQEFDSDFQEAITNVPAPSEDLKGKVIDEVEKGYFLHDKVLRYAKVVVGS